MPNLTTASRSAMLRLRTLFSYPPTSNETDLRHTEPMQVESAQTAGIHAALENNSRQLRYAFNEVRWWSESLRRQLKNKKLNRAELAGDLIEFCELADFGHSLLRDRQRLEQRLAAHRRGPPIPKAEKEKQTAKAGSHE